MAYPCAPPPIRLGPYELQQKLATGGMAEIYVARRVGPHGFSKRIALKRILPQLAADPEFVAMFIDEARLCAQLTHPNLVEVFDFGEQEHELYMAMELVEGTTGAKIVRAAAAKGETVPLELALQMMLSVARGLAHAHEACDESGRPLGLVHRDVSPGNILVSRSGAVKLSDFGIARAAEFNRRTEQGQLKGKLGYMSPEQVTGRELDAQSDQFTAAIVLAEMLTARPLFSGATEMDVLVKIRDADLSNIARYGGHIPDDTRAILMRALSRRPADRFESTTAFVEAIEDVIRRRRLAVGHARLSAFLDRMGLVKAAKSGEHLRPDLVETQTRSPHPSRAPAPGAKRVPSAFPLAGAARSAPPETVTPGEVAPAIYRVLLPDGMVGPLALPRLVELFATGRAFRDTPISREGGPFRPARQIQELDRLCSSLAARWDGGIDNDAALRWTLSRAQWPGQLFDLAIRRVTGLLTVKDGERQKKVFFVDGVPELTASTEASELLGAFLVERGILLPMEVDMGLALAPRYGGRLGDALVSLGVLRPMELSRAVMEQIRARFTELVSWRRGDVSFLEGERCQDEDTIPGACPPFELIPKGIVNGYATADLALLLAPIEHGVIEPVARAPVSVHSLRLAATETAVLESIVSSETVHDIVATMAARGVGERAETLRAIFIGLSSGVLACAGWPPNTDVPSIPTLPMRPS